uniref:ATP synthase F0 subunit 8 n=1 Tax=Stathmonotus gymnodermis TaxID=942588 RepID=UPI0028D4DDFC|nr:ATP synthase F0 subunit 8 [Stathmonotus gymnodermis]WMY90439.1 ATP synthase F0 subunit 8 [Stathmonotus gymnodermis]
MPQLDPAPWFATLVFAWVIFMTLIPTKVLAHEYPNDPLAIAAEKTKTHSWNWQW